MRALGIYLFIALSVILGLLQQYLGLPPGSALRGLLLVEHGAPSGVQGRQAWVPQHPELVFGWAAPRRPHSEETGWARLGERPWTPDPATALAPQSCHRATWCDWSASAGTPGCWPTWW